MEDLYSKNLEAIKKVNISLYEELTNIETNKKFEVFSGADASSNVKILDVANEVWVCNSESVDFKKIYEDLKYYREYPFLYFYGIGNGFIINELLKNEKHKQIVVIEPDIEMLYIALNFMDIQESIINARLVIIPEEKFDFQTAIEIFHSSNARFYTKLFKLNVVSAYYLNQKGYKEVFDIYLKTIEHMIKAFGNDVADSLMGLKHHIKNLPLMISHPKYSELIKSKNSDLAIIVSTGPSLNKQLDLLKQAAEYVTIISVDASFPILCKHGIKPDIVVSMERDKPTSKFFIETTKEDHKGVVFLCASLQHESVFNAIKDGRLLLSMRPFAYNSYFDFDDYGYVCAGMSSANMAHELAGYMNFKRCAFIGQDLAYGEDGASHSKGHVFGADQIKGGLNSTNNAKYETIQLKAYGNKGTVDSMMYWEIFLRFIEQYIDQSKDHMQTINATQGGVHMRGSIELPFKEVIEKFSSKKRKKPIVLSEPTEQEKEKNLLKVKKKIGDILEQSKVLQDKIQKSFLIIAQECKALENLDKEEALKLFDTGKTVFLLDEISYIRKEIENAPIYVDFISSISQALLFNEEFKLASIKVRYVDNPKDNQLKALQWILEHRYWLFSLSGVIENIIYIVNEQSSTYMD